MSKKLKILFLYPNLHMSTLIPNGIAILSAVLKEAGFKNLELFDPTFYESHEVTRAQKISEVIQIEYQYVYVICIRDVLSYSIVNR